MEEGKKGRKEEEKRGCRKEGQKGDEKIRLCVCAPVFVLRVSVCVSVRVRWVAMGGRLGDQQEGRIKERAREGREKGREGGG